MPALSLCVMAWIDSLHTQSQGHHQGLMNERWKGTEVEQRRKREISPQPPQPSPLPHHTCKRLISLLHYQASAAGTGFNSSSSYHWATKMVNLDYLLYLLPNPQYYKYLSCSATWKSDQSREWARWSHTNLLSWDETSLLSNLCVMVGGGWSARTPKRWHVHPVGHFWNERHPKMWFWDQIYCAL